MFKSLKKWFVARKERKQEYQLLLEEASKLLDKRKEEVRMTYEEMRALLRSSPNEEPKLVSKKDPKDRFRWSGNPASLIPLEISRQDYTQIPDVVLMSEQEVDSLITEANIGKMFRAGDGHICKVCKGGDMFAHQWGAGLCGPPAISVKRYAPVFDRLVTVPVASQLKTQDPS